MGIYEERIARIKSAVALEPVDRIPVISGLAAYAAVAGGVNMSDYLNDMELNCTINIKVTGMMAISMESRHLCPLPRYFLQHGCPTSVSRAKIFPTMNYGKS